MMTVDPITTATREVKKYLFVKTSLEEKQVTLALANIAKSCAKEEKAFVHLQIFFHLPYDDEFEEFLEDPGDFAFIVPAVSMNHNTLSPNAYAEIVVEGELLSHFLQTVLYLCDKEYVKELATLVVEKFVSTPNQNNRFPFVVLMLGKISRREVQATTGNDKFYIKLLALVLENFIKHDGVERCEKLCTLFRLIGVCCMQKEDYQASGSDFLELLEEWMYDLTNNVAFDTSKYMRAIFQDKKDEKGEESIVMEMLMLIQDTIVKLGVTDKEFQEWKVTRKTSRISWGEFIGVHAFLTQSVLAKYSESIDFSKIEKLQSILNHWALIRPKLTRDDFQGEVADFGHFFTILKRFGDKDRDRDNLLPKLLDYSYKDIYCSKDGLRVAEKYLVPSGDFETVKRYILKALNKSEMPEECLGAVPGEVKFIIQKLLCSNSEAHLRKDEIVAEIFKNGAHEDLILGQFPYHVNVLCSKIGTIEKEVKDVAQIEHNKDLVYSTCIQSPIRAVEDLLRHSMTSQHFKALAIAKPFLVIPSSPLNNNSFSVGELCFENIVDNADEHDQVFNEIANSIPRLISNDLIIGLDFYENLKKKINAMWLSKQPNLKKILKLIQIMSSLTDVLKSQDQNDKERQKLILEILRFVINTKILTYNIMPEIVNKELLIIRTLSGKIETAIKEECQFAKNVVKTSDMGINEKLPGLSLLQIGNVYVRVPHLRQHIVNFFQDHDAYTSWLQWSSSYETNFANLQNSLVTWITSSDMEEWETILQFVVNIIAKSFGFEDDLLKVFNRSLIFAWKRCTTAESQQMLRQYLKFYNKITKYLLERNLQNPEKIVENIVMLVDMMHGDSKRRKDYTEKYAIRATIQQVLLLLLEELNMIISYNKHFEENLKEDILDSLKLLPIIKGGCESIRKCILDRVLNFSNSNLLPLPEVSSSSKNANGDIQILQRLSH